MIEVEETRRPLRSVEVTLTHKGCGGELMRTDNVMLLSDPPQYAVKCQKCGTSGFAPLTVKRIVHEYADGET